MARMTNSGLQATDSDGNVYEIEIEREEIESASFSGRAYDYRKTVPGNSRITAYRAVGRGNVVIYPVTIKDVRPPNGGPTERKMIAHTDIGEVELRMVPAHESAARNSGNGAASNFNKDYWKSFMGRPATESVVTYKTGVESGPKSVKPASKPQVEGPTSERVINLDELDDD